MRHYAFDAKEGHIRQGGTLHHPGYDGEDSYKAFLPADSTDDNNNGNGNGSANTTAPPSPSPVASSPSSPPSVRTSFPANHAFFANPTFAVDVQTWGLTVFGADIDEWNGHGMSFLCLRHMFCVFVFFANLTIVYASAPRIRLAPRVLFGSARSATTTALSYAFHYVNINVTSQTYN
jgi:hypothetical protein